MHTINYTVTVTVLILRYTQLSKGVMIATRKVSVTKKSINLAEDQQYTLKLSSRYIRFNMPFLEVNSNSN